MKKMILAMWLMGVGLGFAQSDDAECDCSPTPEPGPTPKGHKAPDPAFFGVDPAPKASQVMKVAGKKMADIPNIDLMNYAQLEQASWAEWEKELKANPKEAYELALKIWEANYSKTFQQQVILQARTKVETTDERENLDFMLGCLEDVNIQREACLKLGKGNGLERQLGARRLALLESNPQLAAR